MIGVQPPHSYRAAVAGGAESNWSAFGKGEINGCSDRATWPGIASWRSYFGDRWQAPADRHQTTPPPPRSPTANYSRTVHSWANDVGFLSSTRGHTPFVLAPAIGPPAKLGPLRDYPSARKLTEHFTSCISSPNVRVINL
ncbi:unnamed protein product, partial [Iphiclides podalirius]